MHLRKKGKKDLIQCGIGVTAEESTVMVLQQRKGMASTKTSEDLCPMCILGATE